MQYPLLNRTVHVERVGEDVCVYDWASHRVHALNPTAAFVWQRCDAGTSPAAIAAALERERGVPHAAEVVTVTLRALERAQLVTMPAVSPAHPGVTRRTLLRKGVAAALLPVVHSIVAPSSAAAQTAGAAPTLTGITPNQGSLTGPTTSVAVTLTGTNFISGATTVAVSGSGVIAQNVVVGSGGTSLTATFVMAGLAALSVRNVTVTTAAGMSNPLAYTVNAGRFVDLGVMIRDTQQTLLWEKKTAPGTGGLNDVGNTYTWCAATGNAVAGTPCAGNTASWIADVNVASFAGFNDWRVPARTELETIVAPAGSPRIDPIFGPTAAAGYWTSTEFNTLDSFQVDFSAGIAIIFPKSIPGRVRAVRSGP